MAGREGHALQGDEGGEPGEEVERLEEHGDGAVAGGALETLQRACTEPRPTRRSRRMRIASSMP